MAERVPNMFCYFYGVKNQRMAYNITNNEAREKNKLKLGILRILEKV
jgi:hypothetical protein